MGVSTIQNKSNMAMTQNINKIFLFAILATVSLSVYGQVTQLGQKCVAYWDMESTGATEPDRIGNNDGTVTGATSVTGANGLGRSFDGIDDVINLAAQSLGNNLSISAWAKATATGYTYRNVIGRYFGNTKIFISSSSRYYGSINGSGYQQATTHDANWHHFVVVKSTTTNLVYFYIDATLIGSSANTDNEEFPTDVWQIGAHGNSSQWWNGIIDEVGLFNQSLSSADVLELYNSGIAPDFDSWYSDIVPLNTFGIKTGSNNRVMFLGGRFISYKYIRESINSINEPVLTYYAGPDYTILSHDQKMFTDDGVPSGDVIGTFDPWYVTDYKISGTFYYSLIDSENGLYSINSTTGIITKSSSGSLSVGIDTLRVEVSLNNITKSYYIFVKVDDDANCVFIDPSVGTNGSGTRASPKNTWSGLTFVPGYSYKQKRGTTYLARITASVDGTPSNRITLTSYGNSTTKPKLNCTYDHGVVIAADYYNLTEFIIEKSGGAGIRQQAAGGLYTNWFISDIILNSNCYSSVFGRMEGGQIYLIKPTGMPTTFPWFTNTYSHVIEDVIAYDDGTVDTDVDGDEQYGIKDESGDVTITNYYGYNNRSKAISATGSSYNMKVTGLLAVNNRWHGIEISGRHHELSESIVNMATAGVRTVSIEDTASQDILIHHNDLSGKRDDGTTKDGSIVIEGIVWNGIPPDYKYKARKITIEDNIIHDAIQSGHSHSAIWVGFNSDNITIRRNIIYGSTIGITIGANSTNNECDTSYIANNIFYNNGTDISILHGSKHYIYNNTATSSIITTVSTGAVRGNFYTTLSSSSPISNNLAISPSYFIDYTNKDFHLVPSTSAIDGGYNWGQTIDFEGNGLIGTQWDVGAYEYQP